MKKINWTFILLGITTLLISSCGNNSTENEGGIAEKIEFPVIDFSINPAVDTTIFGPQGTRVFIGAQTFLFEDGTIATDSINIKLQEYYSMSDIILADLVTQSDDKLLETAGMLHISATSNGKTLEIGAGKQLVVHLPKESDDYRKMNLFYADPTTATDSSVANWSIDTVSLVKQTLKLGSFGWWYPAYDDSTGYDFTPKNFVDTGYYRNPLDFYISAYDFTESTLKEIDTALNTNNHPNFKNWNDYGVECEMEISTEGYIKNVRVITKVSAATQKEIIQFLKNLPQLEPGTNKNGEIIERRGLLFIQSGVVIPLYKTDEEYLKSFDKKYAQYEDEPVQNMDDAELNFYVFSVTKLGWINCDRFVDAEETIDVICQTPVDPKTNLKMAFNTIDGVLKAKVIDGHYVFSNVPVGRRVTIVGTQNQDGNLKTAFLEMSIKGTDIGVLQFSATTLNEFREKLEKL